MKNTALSIVKRLSEKGFEAYFAGGCVRDLLMGNEPLDIDIATSARPEEIESLFKKTYAIGKHFGVIFILENGHHFEVATFRSDAGYSDGRRPDAIFFTDAKEDALRRDFTINGMFYDPISDKVLDFIGGKNDLERKILRFIGNPNQRIQEDFLRMLRAVRFKNRFGFVYDAGTWDALEQHSSLVVSVSAERIRDELTKILLHSSRSEALSDLFSLGILEKVLPEIAELDSIPQPKKYHSEGNVLRHIELVLRHIREDPSEALVWGALLHDIGKKETLSYTGERIRFLGHQNIGAEKAEKMLTRLKFPKKLREGIVWLVQSHHLFDQFFDMTLPHRLKYYDHPFFLDLLALHTADIMGSLPEDPHGHEKPLAAVEWIRNDYDHHLSQHLLPSHIPDLLSGNKIMEILGIPSGNRVGKLKKALREAQLGGTVKNKEEAEEWIRKSEK